MGIFEWLSVALFAVIAVIHIVSAILKGRICVILEYVNIPLHIVAVVLLLFAGATLDVLLLSFMSSFLIYLLCRVLFGKGKGGAV